MKVVDVRVYSAVNDLAGKVWNPKIRWTRKHSVIVEVVTDDGLSGIGECWCFDRTPEPLVAFLRSEVLPFVVGAEAGDCRALHQALWSKATLAARHGILASALAGIDIALWDAAARRANVPLYRLLGGDDGDLSVYASGGLYAEHKDADRLADELAGYVAQGFSQVKLKVGALSPAEDAARVERVRARLGDAVGLIVDGVYSYDAAGAAAFYRRIESAAVSAFQSPVAADDVAGMVWLVNECGVPVMALEAEYRLPVIRLLLERRAVAILQIAPVACGGLTPARDILDEAAAAGVPASLEVSSTAVATMAAFHLAAAHGAVIHAEHHMVHQVLFETLPFAPGAVSSGRLQLPDLPGLGLELPLGALQRHL
jgi:L-alanine-DL-glutamate epimerase-like enolase superfamily enzyme